MEGHQRSHRHPRDRHPAAATGGSQRVDAAELARIGGVAVLTDVGAFLQTLLAGALDDAIRALIWNQAHLRRILSQYETHHNQHRPYRSLHAAAPPKSLPRTGRS
jgi:hypothetical protein